MQVLFYRDCKTVKCSGHAGKFEAYDLALRWPHCNQSIYFPSNTRIFFEFLKTVNGEIYKASSLEKNKKFHEKWSRNL